jgi:hypothetical protein
MPAEWPVLGEGPMSENGASPLLTLAEGTSDFMKH